MSTRYDEKGKFFTDRVTKEQIPVIIQTVFGRIEGFFYVMAGARLKDEINNSEQFIALTNVKVYDLDGNCEFICDFLSLNRDHIVWLAPQSEVRFLEK
ncbi:MAG: hypothetical protein N3D16_01675 [Anaerolineales bacterium]|nr:hypothetical protein [Anaerolineales bacterium]